MVEEDMSGGLRYMSAEINFCYQGEPVDIRFIFFLTGNAVSKRLFCIGIRCMIPVSSHSSRIQTLAELPWKSRLMNAST
ncbi:MAG: hypothetical protein NTY91_01375 [Euryarchaeota archaeon]|nr:hypothetical protein [Euryarchaeota archaeon]